MAGFFTDFTTNDICWTTTPYSEKALQNVPSIEMWGWEQNWSAVITNIHNWFKKIQTGSASSNPYAGLYMGTFKRAYKLPYFNEYHHATQQSWGAGQGPVGDSIQEGMKLIETTAKTFMPQAGILVPQSYEGSTPATYSFSFTLINTSHGAGKEAEDHVMGNRIFLEQFIEDNLHAMNGYLSITPPLVYEIYIPGIRWCPAAVVSSLTVNNKGTMNKNIGGTLFPDIDENYIYPDAWEVTVGITELISESKQLYKDSIKGSMNKSNITTKAFGG